MFSLERTQSLARECWSPYRGSDAMLGLETSSRQMKRAQPSKEVMFVTMTEDPAVTDTDRGQEPHARTKHREGGVPG